MSKLKIFGLLALTLLTGFMGGTLGGRLVEAKPTAHRVIKAQEIQLQDQRGVTRASIDLTSKGDIFFALYDAKGKASESMLITPGMIKASRKTAATVAKLERMFSGIMPGK